MSLMPPSPESLVCTLGRRFTNRATSPASHVGDSFNLKVMASQACMPGNEDVGQCTGMHGDGDLPW